MADFVMVLISLRRAAHLYSIHEKSTHAHLHPKLLAISGLSKQSPQR